MDSLIYAFIHIQFLASSIEFWDDIACDRHEFSSHANSASYSLTEKFYFTMKKLSVNQKKQYLWTSKFMFFLTCKSMSKMKIACKQFYN